MPARFPTYILLALTRLGKDSPVSGDLRGLLDTSPTMIPRALVSFGSEKIDLKSLSMFR